MSSSVRTLLAAASRPFIHFSATINDEVFNLLARKLSLANQEHVSNSWDSAYELAKEKYQDKDSSNSIIFSAIDRLTPSQLAKYISDSDRNDLLPEAIALNDNKPKDDPEVVAALDHLVAERKHELEALSVDDLKKLAGDRRVHFYALFKANEASSRLMASLMIYDVDKNLVFDEGVDEITIDDLTTLIEAASKALAGVSILPLGQVPAQPLDNVTPLVPSST